MKVTGLRHSAEKTGGIMFFGRMLDKIRLHAAGKLPADYNCGFGFDGRVCRFLRVEYAAVVEQVNQGGTDEQILEWCFTQGRRPNDEEVAIFNSFLSKRGWRDETAAELAKMKQDRGFLHRTDILTFFDFHKADEED